MSQKFRHWSATHAGTVRPDNQDGFCCRPEIGLFAVTDGVGGRVGGELATATIVARLQAIPGTLPPEQRVAAARASLQDAHATLRMHAPDTEAGPAATVVLLLLHESHFVCLWAGDSRVYLLRDGILHALTTDHSLVQELLNTGAIDAQEAEAHPSGHVITRAVGAGVSELDVDKVLGEYAAADRFLLCSDGLYRTLQASDMAKLLPLDYDVAAGLVTAALQGAARDNVTAVVVCDGAATGRSPP